MAGRHKCYECGKTAHHGHHLIPKSLGGTRTIPVCRKCHAKIHSLEKMATSKLVKEGLRRAVEAGKVLGRPLTSKRKTQRVLNMYKRGFSSNAIAKKVKISRRTVSRILQRAKK